jgi:hypothetical protein
LLAFSAGVQSPGAVDVEKLNNEGADIGGATNVVVILISPPVEPVPKPLVQHCVNEVVASRLLHVESVEARNEGKRPIEQGSPSCN